MLFLRVYQLLSHSLKGCDQSPYTLYILYFCCRSFIGKKISVLVKSVAHRSQISTFVFVDKTALFFTEPGVCIWRTQYCNELLMLNETNLQVTGLGNSILQCNSILAPRPMLELFQTT
jgi:hypothetical protein